MNKKMHVLCCLGNDSVKRNGKDTLILKRYIFIRVDVGKIYNIPIGKCWLPVLLVLTWVSTWYFGLLPHSKDMLVSYIAAV